MRLWWIFVLLSVACVPTPSYLVRVQGNTAGVYCGGQVIDGTHVVVANHCVVKGFDTVLRPSGEPLSSTVVARWPEIDLAVLETNEEIGVAQFARYADETPASLGYVHGFCPLRINPRPAVLSSRAVDWGTRPYCQTWELLTWITCSGDSAGTIDWEGEVQGMVITVIDWGIDDAMLEGNLVCILPGSVIAQKLNEEREVAHGIR